MVTIITGIVLPEAPAPNMDQLPEHLPGASLPALTRTQRFVAVQEAVLSIIHQLKNQEQ